MIGIRCVSVVFVGGGCAFAADGDFGVMESAEPAEGAPKPPVAGVVQVAGGRDVLRGRVYRHRGGDEQLLGVGERRLAMAEAVGRRLRLFGGAG